MTLGLLLALSTWFAPGLAWTVPVPGEASSYHRLTQDTALSLLLEVDGGCWLAQGEVAVGGLNAGEPSFTLVAARAGAFLLRGAVDVSVSLGGGFMSYGAKSVAECPNFGCDPFAGAGPAAVAEIAARFASSIPVRGGIFADMVVPLFNVHQTQYYAPSEVRAVGVFALGVRLFL